MKRTRWLLVLMLVCLVVFLTGSVSADGWDSSDWSVIGTYHPICNAGHDSSINDLPAAAFTAEMVVRIDKLGTWQGMFSKGDNSPAAGWQLATYSTLGRPCFQIVTTTSTKQIMVITDMRDASWHHIAVTYDNLGDRLVRIWIDGQLGVTSSAVTGDYVSDAAYDLRLFRSWYDYSHAAVRWARLSDAEIYTTPFSPPWDFPGIDGDTVEAWAFDEGSGSLVAASVSSANDCSLTGTYDWDYWDLDNFADGITAWWDLEEETGTRYDEVAGGNVDLTDNNTVPRLGGVVGYAAGFDAANSEYLSHTDSAYLSTGPISYTLAAWVNLDLLTGDQEIISKGDGATGEYRLYYDGTAATFEFGASDGASFTTVSAAAPSPAITETWYLVVGQHDATAQELEILVYDSGGALSNQNTAACVGCGVDNSDPFYVGRAGSDYLSGSTDSIGIWKGKTLNRDETAWLFNGADGRDFSAFPTPSPVPTPTPTPNPAAAEYGVTLPTSNYTGKWYATMTAGESSIVLVLLAILFLGIYKFLRETVLKWVQRGGR